MSFSLRKVGATSRACSRVTLDERCRGPRLPPRVLTEGLDLEHCIRGLAGKPLPLAVHSPGAPWFSSSSFGQDGGKVVGTRFLNVTLQAGKLRPTKIDFLFIVILRA